ncbi:MAG: hypothetical protein H8D34_04450 [Chloroflexi bacterium]|nr:hypothetical protein [Chloroflexota bacterium]
MSSVFAPFGCGLPVMVQQECSDITSLYWNEIKASDPLNAQKKGHYFFLDSIGD